jgi:hypothetical protein
MFSPPPPPQVLVAAFTKRKQVCPSNTGMLHGSQNNVPNHGFATSPNIISANNLLHTEKFRYDPTF